jgi:choline dehydrogenase-like flavoprotein
VPTSPTPQQTDFSRDVLGRYICNGLDEALASTSGHPDARPFDVVIIGGGSFGPVLAQQLFARDTQRRHRILVLDAGPFVLPEHVQNLPMLGLQTPPPATADPGVARNEVWGLPWRAPDVRGGFPGLAYCLGGRSLFWGGWSPLLLDAEMPADRWPASVVADLNARYFPKAAEQIGTSETNDFIFGTMHEELRTQLFKGIDTVDDAVPLDELPPHGVSPDLKLEAPLAVVGRPPRSGFFPLNKFSAMPLLMHAARRAQSESGGNDVNKRLMVVPNCHVTTLETAVSEGIGTVRTVHTTQGTVSVPPDGIVVLAAGTIESIRLALLSFEGTLGHGLIGTNLLGHVRSNYTVRIPRGVLGSLPTGDLEASALFVKGRKTHGDGSVSHFHFQITTSGLKEPGGNSEVELFQKIPDIDLVDRFRAADEEHVVMTIRGIGEMQPGNPDSSVRLDDATDELTVRRAVVAFGDSAAPATPGESTQTTNDRALWQAMDDAALQVREIFTGAGDFEEIERRRDGLGTTHHEAGGLFMGDDPTASVTTPHARFHHVLNAYAVGPALLPTIGSPNPMLSGVALARRLADHLTGEPSQIEPDFASLFDGTAASLEAWQHVGPGRFDLDERQRAVVAQPGDDIGLLFYAADGFDDFVLRLQFRIADRSDNSGVFVRFRDPLQPGAPNDDPHADNPAWAAVHTGFEAQIDERARPDGADEHRTGAIYAVPVGPAAGQQRYRPASPLRPGEWNDLEIEVRDTTYRVRCNGHQTALFTNDDPARGAPASADPTSGRIGLQTHTGRVAFRAIRIKRL